MAISLLQCGNEKSDATPIGEKILYHLSLDRSFSYVCADIKKRAHFLSMVSKLTDNREDILYRQAILQDFQNHPDLLQQLLSLYARFEELKKSSRNAGKDEFRLSVSKTSSASASQSILQSQALSLKRGLLFVKAFGELLSKYDLKSAGLNAFSSDCRDLYENAEFANLLAFCSKYESFSINGFLDFKITLNEEGRIAECQWIDHRYIHITDPDLKKKGFSLFKKAEEAKYPCQRVFVDRNEFYEGLTTSAFSDLSKLFSSLFEQIIDRYFPIYYELDFYDVALKYIAVLTEKKVPFCFPAISTDNRVKVSKLYDLYLLLSEINPTNVVPNDLEMTGTSGGLVVFGNNGSGKTVYLRSIGTMQLLAQAGLPIPCESATITLCSQIATQFSEAEKEFAEGNDAGRFEQEVRELAAMVDTLQAGALVFLNETFQSTAYAEGAEGLYHLLQHFSQLGIRWILVSHLRQLENLFAPDDATVLHTADGYKIIE